MKPDFRVVADSKDITDLLRDRLLSIRTTDKAGVDSDECEIHIDDRDGAVAFPKRGAVLAISLGYEGQPLTFVGRYKVDEIEISGPPQSIVIRGKPADIAASMKDQKRGSWEGAKLADIVSDIAGRNKLQALCRVDADVPRVDQINESDMHFITRLAARHGATATVKDGKLIVARRGDGKSGSGQALPLVTVGRADLASYSMTFPDRSAFGKVRVGYHDNKTGALRTIELPNKDAPPDAQATIYTDRHVHPTAAAAGAAAKSRVQALNRATVTGRLELMDGRADVGAEKRVKLVGIKNGADGEYLIESVEQNFTKSSWITTISINAGNSGKAKAGRTKSSGAGKKALREIELD